MAIGPDSRTALCVARQPILDHGGNVFGYELLYRAEPGATDCTASGDLAGARMLTDAVLALGLDTLTGGLPAFINLTRQLLLADAGTLLPPQTTVLELREDITIDDEVLDACRRLHRRGYSLSLDDFEEGSAAEVLIPWVDFVKVDMLTTPPERWAPLAARVRAQGPHLIAEKVETGEVAAQAHDAGYSLFQGYFFCRPRTFVSAPLPARRLVYLNLLSELNRENVTLDAVDNLVKHDVSLSYRVLRYVNSAAYAQRQEVTSIRRALMLMGVAQIRKWASVWSLAGLSDGGTPETVSIAVVRARCCELLGDALPPPADTGGFFLLGLCSLLDVILHRPMADALASMPLPATVRDALLGESNYARAVLDAVIAYEQGEWNEATSAAASVHLTLAQLRGVYSEAIAWARQLTEAAKAA